MAAMCPGPAAIGKKALGCIAEARRSPQAAIKQNDANGRKARDGWIERVIAGAIFFRETNG